ncbi:TonB-dependent receptor [Catenovulum sediminis]|uniref:TonB-dependent receptor n=1 Tax=Catenovulum sediminis TaxID=1740262 RepID=A0ABV1RCY9_9ALTE
MIQTHKINAVTAAIALSLLTAPSWTLAQEQEKAQETNVNNANENQEEQIETIEITGFRGSLQKAINAKRFNSGVSDSIHAEDVGKSTDQNIADALSRVTGVTVQEEGGEGTRISVRGAGASLNQISMNGVALTSGLSGDGADPSADQSVDLSAFSSNILSSIDVLKTSAADQDEGSLGATVILRTVKPLGLIDPRRQLQAEARYNDFSDKSDHLISASFSEKFFNDTFGFVVTATQEKIKTREDRLETEWVEGALQVSDLNAASGLKAHDAATGKYIRTLAEGQTVEDLDGWDPTTQVAHEGDLYVLARDFSDMGLLTNENERTTIAAGFQYRPTEATDIQLDITSTKRTRDTQNHRLRLNHAPSVGFSNKDPIEDYNAVDLQTNTLVKSLGRSQSGFYNISEGLTEISTNVASLKIEHYFTDTFKMDLTGGYSKTTDKTDGFIGLTTATWGTTTAQITEEMPDEIIEPIGYDCEGKECRYFSGTVQSEIDPLDGTVTLATSRFNPFDLQANHLGGLNFRNNDQTDTNKSLFVDFDWDLDGDFLTKVEFGAKVSQRIKDVYTQSETINNGTSLVDSNDPNIEYATTGMQSIRVVDMLRDEAFPYDNFAEGIVEHRDNAWFNGWPMLDPKKAIEAFANREPGSVGVSRNNLGTRKIQTDTQALYGKLNFELMDGQLTGNLGIRYIKDQNKANGVGGITYYRNPHVLDPHDLLINRRLADIEGSQPCPEPVANLSPETGDSDTRYGAANASELTNCWDWAITHGYAYNDNTTIPWTEADGWRIPGANGQTGPDVNRLVWVDYSGATPQVMTNNPLPNQIYDVNGNLVDTVRNRHRNFAATGEVWQYLDLSTAWTGPNGNVDATNRREAPIYDEGEYSMWLPSLNLNYAINAEMIGRFAVSKTMSRPRFDSLNPASVINENMWDPTAGANAGNTQLVPLESKNLDLSYEWYFNESGLLSLALFYKDMTNFEEEVITPYHYKDVRTDYELTDSSLLLPFDVNRMPGGEDDCMPHRYAAAQNNSWAVECHQVSVDLIKNGQGATIKGLEFGYTQNYDFLPGIWSGLGASLNYTYQQSESDPEQIGTTERFLKPLPQPYTPEHSANTTLFWEKNGVTLRLAHRYNSTQLASRGLNGGASWQEATNRLDFSTTYELNKTVSLTFHATNLTDDQRRIYFTSSQTASVTDSTNIVMDEGNVLDDSSITTDRTLAVYRNGRHFRLGIRANF